MFSKELMEKALSKQRLTAYNKNQNSSFDTILGRYEYNLRLSNSLYPLLHVLEVTLRNAIEEVFVQDFGVTWYESNSTFREREFTKIQDAKNSLVRFKKIPDSGRIIAELHFGFWTSLFDRHYDSKLWHQKNRLLRLFPNMQARDRYTRNIAAKIEKIRRLRNRVFHYEPIFHWADLKRQHDDILDFIYWMNLDSCAFIKKMDEFNNLHKNTF